MSFLKSAAGKSWPGSSSKPAEPKLDLKALQSYSPSWSPALRYTACIAARCAAAQCVKQVKEIADALEQTQGGKVASNKNDSTDGKDDESAKNERFEEEGEDEHTAKADSEDAQRRQRRRIEFVEDWEEWAQKFATATAQHLGIDEATLPPGEISADDVLKAARGSSFKRKSDGDGIDEKTGSLSLQDKEKETEGQKEEEGLLKDDQAIEIVHELLLVALGLGQYRASDGSTMLFEQDMLFGDLPEDETYDTSSPTSVPAGVQGTTRRADRSSEKAIAEAETRPNESNIEPREKDAVDIVSEAGQKAWSTLSTGAVTGWKALGKGVQDASRAISGNQEGNGAGAGTQGTSAGAPYTPRKGKDTDSRKQVAPTKPNEICHYDARARAVIFATCHVLGVQGIDVYQGEKAVAQSIFFLLQEGRQAAETKTAGGDPLSDLPRQGARGAWMNKVSETTVEKEKRKANWGKWAATGAGFAIGGVIIGLTGGLAAPIVAPALVGLTGVSFLATTSGIVLMGTLLGLGGGGLAGYRVQQRLRGLDSFEFVEMKSQAHEAGLAIPSLHATICISGLLLKEEDQVVPWEKTFAKTIDSRDVYAIKTETKMMVEAGNGLRGYVLEQVLRTGGQKAAEQIIKHTALAGFAALTLPLTVMGAASAALDGVFVRAKTKAHKAGFVLAETLRKEVQGHRPVILVGTSLGCTTILAALVELAKDPSANAHLIDSVFLISGPMTPSPTTLRRARSIVGRRFVNAYSSKDMVCSIASWLGSGISVEEMRNGQLPRVVGSGPITGVANVENYDVSDILGSHFEINEPTKMRQVLERCRALQD